MKRVRRRKLILFASFLSVLTAGLVAGRQFYISRPSYGIPYIARFTPDVEDPWTALDGTWDVVNGSMHNDSNDRGAKLLTGSPNWKDYILRADLQLLGTGSVGVMARVSEAEVGENSFKGYWAGVRTVDNSLVLGAFDFAYHEAAKVRLPQPVVPMRWYHIQLTVEGCRIVASASAAGMAELSTPPLNDPDCFRSGSIGLRSNATGGVWRNVKVLPLNSVAEKLSLPANSAVSQNSAAEPQGSVPTQSLLSLQFLPPLGSPVASVRGSVTLTRPVVFVQDSTGRGGIEVRPRNPTTLKIGDDVEVTGQVNLDSFSPVIRNAEIRRLAEAVPVSPLVLTVNQVATGAYDGRFVQIEGYLQAIDHRPDGASTLALKSGSQSFHAILPAGGRRWHLKPLALESRLRVRGISVVDPRFNNAADPFVILVRSAEGVDVVAGPPWWRSSNLIMAAVVALGLAFTLNYLYLLAKHWRLRAVAEERERLAHEIHDTLAQSFAGIGFQLQAIRNSMPRDSHLLEGQVERAMLMARTSHEEARRSIASLRPESLGRIGLLPALRECAERMVKNGKVDVETQGEESYRDVPMHVKDTFFRIGQEAIANSIRHAAPGTIRIRLQQQRSSLCLSVEDDGYGFIVDSDHFGFGLLGMRKRAESISATLVIRSAPGSGTQVEVKAAVGSRFRALAWPGGN